MAHLRLGALKPVPAAILLVRLIRAVIITVAIILLVDALPVLALELVVQAPGTVQFVGAVGAVRLPIATPRYGDAVPGIAAGTAAREALAAAVRLHLAGAPVLLQNLAVGAGAVRHGAV